MQIQSLCVYCGSAMGNNPGFRQTAQELGQILAQNQIRLVYGGTNIGLMGILADAVLAHGGKVTGVVPDCIAQYEIAHTRIELIRVKTMHERKQKMIDLAEAFAILPGGMGTLEEFFEVLSWKKINLHNKPIVIINYDAYWDKLIDLCHVTVQHGFAQSPTISLFDVVQQVSEVPPLLAKK